MKSPPARGVKEFLKPLAYGRPEGYARLVRGGLMACLLKYEPASSSAWSASPPRRRAGAAKASPNRAFPRERGIAPRRPETG